ncbi:MAG: lantibiotic immunity ABC transporter MutG family permease subunit [Acetivibrio sp.]
MTFYANLKADIYKIFHTPLWAIHIVIPVIGIVLFVWYDSFSPWKEENKLSTYIQVLSIVFPILIGIITSILAETEEKAGEFQMLLTTEKGKYIPHISKLISLILFGFASAFLALAGFGIGFMRIGYTTFSLLFYVKTAVLLVLSVIPLYVLEYMVSFLFGKGFGIGIGIVGGLLSALLLTGLGDEIWWYLPWGIAARFSEGLLRSSLSNTKFFQYKGIMESTMCIFLFSLIFMVLLILIFNKWEGRTPED